MSLGALLEERDNLLRLKKSAENLTRTAEVVEEFSSLDLALRGVIWRPEMAIAVIEGPIVIEGEVRGTVVARQGQYLDIRAKSGARAKAPSGETRVKLHRINQDDVIFLYNGVKIRVPISKTVKPEETSSGK